VHRKQSKKEKAERQQTELLRLQELLHLQTLLDALGDDAVRERLKSVPGDLVSVFSESTIMNYATEFSFYCASTNYKFLCRILANGSSVNMSRSCD